MQVLQKVTGRINLYVLHVQDEEPPWRQMQKVGGRTIQTLWRTKLVSWKGLL